MRNSNILTRSQIIQSEKLFLKNKKNFDLIELVAKKILRYLEESFPHKKILIISGPGNNGGDGRELFRIAKRSKIKISNCNLMDLQSNELSKFIANHDLICDAIFGFGFNRPFDKFFFDSINIINRSKKMIISFDIPSGVCSNTGMIFNTSIRADITLALGFFKPCHFLQPGKSKCGKLEYLNLNYTLPKKRYPEIKLINNRSFNSKILFKKEDINKYHRGSLVVFGGTMAGASRIVALTARKIGGGISSIKINKDQLINYAGTEPGTIVNFSEDIDINKYNCVVIGPGLGKNYEFKKILDIIKIYKKTLILDADALSIFENKKTKLYDILKKRALNILTPHEGEFIKLFGPYNNDKIASALSASKKTNSIIIFKGNDTVITTPEGKVWVGEKARSSLATAGTGDMLCGMIGGLICQGMEAIDATLNAIWIQQKLSNNIKNTTIEDFISDLSSCCRWLK